MAIWFGILADGTDHHNHLNMKLQGNNILFHNLVNDIVAFMMNLNQLYPNQMVYWAKKYVAILTTDQGRTLIGLLWS